MVCCWLVTTYFSDLLSLTISMRNARGSTISSSIWSRLISAGGTTSCWKISCIYGSTTSFCRGGLEGSTCLNSISYTLDVVALDLCFGAAM